MVNDDLDILFFRIFQFPIGSLAEITRPTRHDFHIISTQAQRRATAIHCGVTNTYNQHALTNTIDVFESDRLKPGDTDMDIGVTFFTTGQPELFTLGCTAADKYRVVTFSQQTLHTLDRGVKT